MTQTRAKWQNVQQVQWDQVEYDTSVVQCDTELFRATWICCECHEEGVLEPVASTAAEAIVLAKIGVSVHHALLHQRGSRPKPR
jgi:hypothetical protein